MVKKPYIIGIAGPSGSGKTELARHLTKRLPATVTLISLDSYYRDLSGLEPAERDRCNFDVPEALDWELLRQHLHALAQGQEIEKPVYQFSTHTRAPQGERVKPGEFIIVEGLFALYEEEIRRPCETKVFVETGDAVCLKRRLARDTCERGRSPESVLAQYAETVRPMCERYVLPTRHVADVVVSGEDPVEISATRVIAHIERNRACAPGTPRRMKRDSPTDEKCQLMLYPLEPFIRWRDSFEGD